MTCRQCTYVVHAVVVVVAVDVAAAPLPALTLLCACASSLALVLPWISQLRVVLGVVSEAAGAVCVCACVVVVVWMCVCCMHNLTPSLHVALLVARSGDATHGTSCRRPTAVPRPGDARSFDKCNKEVVRLLDAAKCVRSPPVAAVVLPPWCCRRGVAATPFVVCCALRPLVLPPCS